MTAVANPSSSLADVIDVSQFRKLMADDPALRILDVRSGGEFETAHIPGSYNVPLETLGEHATDLAAVDRPVVLVCQTGGRASKAHNTLQGNGKTALHILEGGIVGWQASGGDVIVGDQSRWAMDRQVRLVAGSMTFVSVLLSLLVPRFKWLAAFVGFGLSFSAVSNTCAMASVLSRLPYNRSDRCDIQGVLADLNQKD